MSRLRSSSIRIKAYAQVLIVFAAFQLSLSKDLHGKDASYSSTKYPVVMVPGALAFDNILGVLDYWYGITEEMRSLGADVYVTNLSSSAAHVQRGEELLEDIRVIRAMTGAEKVNLYAHSQGATAARYVASVMPHWVASVSCMNCMNEGTAFADSLDNFLSTSSRLKWIANIVGSTFFTLLEKLTVGAGDGDYNSPERRRQVAVHLMEAAGTDNFKEFNARFPEALSKQSCELLRSGKDYTEQGGEPVVNGVRYYSAGGDSVRTSLLDPLDTAFVPVIKLFYPTGHVWDGLVPACGHPLGDLVEGRYDINHFDAINQVMGIVSSGVHVPSLFTMQVNRLKNAGL